MLFLFTDPQVNILLTHKTLKNNMYINLYLIVLESLEIDLSFLAVRYTEWGEN